MASPHTSTTGKKTASAAKGRSTAKTASTSRAKDAIALLKADHRAVETLFAQFGRAKDADRKERLASEIILELRVHTQIEEEIFYPASREVLKDEDIVNEAIVEHQAAKDLMDQIDDMAPQDEMFDAKVTVLQEMIEHHVGEEEKDFFPQVQKTDLDLKAIGQQMAERKEALMAEMGSGKGSPIH